HVPDLAVQVPVLPIELRDEGLCIPRLSLSFERAGGMFPRRTAAARPIAAKIAQLKVEALLLVRGDALLVDRDPGLDLPDADAVDRLRLTLDDGNDLHAPLRVVGRARPFAGVAA